MSQRLKLWTLTWVWLPLSPVRVIGDIWKGVRPKLVPCTCRAFLNANVPYQCSHWGMLRSLVAFAALVNGRLRRLAVRRKLEEACWRRSHAHCRRGHAPSKQTEPQLEAATTRALLCLKLDNSCCYARYSCGNNCNVVVKLVQECKLLFWRILLPFCRNSSPRTTRFLGKRAVTIKRVLALRNYGMFCLFYILVSF